MLSWARALQPTSLDILSTQLVAVREGTRGARDIIARAALHKVRLIRMFKEYERRPVVDGARVASHLPANFHEALD